MTDEVLVLPSVTMGIGEAVVRYRSPDHRIRFLLRSPRTKFRVIEDGAVTCDVECTQEQLSPTSGQIRGVGRTWEVRSAPDGGEEARFYQWTGTRQREQWLAVRFNSSYSLATAVRKPTSDATEWWLGYPLDEYVHCRLLGRRGVLLLHAASVRDGDSSLVFVGPSGAGKSTLSSIAETQGARVLSDDRTLVGMVGNAPTAWGTPWHGTFHRGRADGAPIRAVFLLHHADADSCRRIPAADAFKAIWTRVLHAMIGTAEAEAAVAMLDHVIQAVPIFELRFVPGAAAYSLARNA
jgi:hypothetical protein